MILSFSIVKNYDENLKIDFFSDWHLAIPPDVFSSMNTSDYSGSFSKEMGEALIIGMGTYLDKLDAEIDALTK